MQDHTSESPVSAQSLLAPDTDTAPLPDTHWEIASWHSHEGVTDGKSGLAGAAAVREGVGGNDGGEGAEPDPVELVVSLSQPGMAITRILFLSGAAAYDPAQIPEVRHCKPLHTLRLFAITTGV